MKKKRLKAPLSSIAHEKELANLIEYMTDQTIKSFKNQVLLGMNKTTVNKFTDGQVGNYAAIFIGLSKKFKRRILKRFDDKRLTKATRAILAKANRHNQKNLYGPASEIMGISADELIRKEGLKPNTSALIAETLEWVKKTRDETISFFTANSLRVMSQGKSFTELLDDFDMQASKRKNHAKFIARNQMSNFNTQLNRIRHSNLGIEKGVWSTSHDERVRSSHSDRDGKEFYLKEGLFDYKDGKTLLPGEDYNCRCTYFAVLPDLS